MTDARRIEYLSKKIAALEASLNARQEALEEAAQAAEEKTAGWFDERAYVGQSIAAAIRALKEEG